MRDADTLGQGRAECESCGMHHPERASLYTLSYCLLPLLPAPPPCRSPAYLLPPAHSLPPVCPSTFMPAPPPTSCRLRTSSTRPSASSRQELWRPLGGLQERTGKVEMRGGEVEGDSCASWYNDIGPPKHILGVQGRFAPDEMCGRTSLRPNKWEGIASRGRRCHRGWRCPCSSAGQLPAPQGGCADPCPAFFFVLWL